MSPAVGHPRLVSTDASSLGAFLRSYNQYASKVHERVEQLVVDGVTFTKILAPLHIKSCEDPEWTESLISLGFLDGVPSYDALTEDELRAYLNSKAEELKETVALDDLDEIVAKELCINMSDSALKSRIQNFFRFYHSL
eukprot:Plantae.Rhodophyta-Rhodochaete_pulchella.ctg8067.p2 GENE.Plantae.Rhodophyta-Rhodochaete_pulchella.ctg8067~~Plantae.Rhodophyta-Rhodochaete_pulchella.ctg8067.p2  ORF type:complete len:139 (+),score=24.65 Plantae.Rhodophyta-Rhodochaete_pulchella.ctg8067:187-603(+)